MTIPDEPPQARSAAFLLTQLGTLAHMRLAERLRPLGLHPRHLGMLGHLTAAEGSSQQALADALGVHRSAMVALVDDLEARGLAERRRDPADRRAYTLHLTSEGRRRFTELRELADRQESELLAGLDAGEQRALVDLLRRLAASQGLAPGVHPRLTPPGSDP
jgi:DNA-binding MarR family transcriptional regulator